VVPDPQEADDGQGHGKSKLGEDGLLVSKGVIREAGVAMETVQDQTDVLAQEEEKLTCLVCSWVEEGAVGGDEQASVWVCLELLSADISHVLHPYLRHGKVDLTGQADTEIDDVVDDDDEGRDLG